MGNKFICESCGKEVDCGDKNPANWKQKLCYTCRLKQKSSTPVAPAKAQAVTKYEPAKAFNVEQYINELVEVYEMFTYVLQGKGIELPPESICAWATSLMIQKGKNNG